MWKIYVLTRKRNGFHKITTQQPRRLWVIEDELYEGPYSTGLVLFYPRDKLSCHRSAFEAGIMPNLIKTPLVFWREMTSPQARLLDCCTLLPTATKPAAVDVVTVTAISNQNLPGFRYFILLYHADSFTDIGIWWLPGNVYHWFCYIFTHPCDAS